MRCLVIARAIRQRWSKAPITFFLHQDAPYFPDHPFDAITFSGNHKDKDAQITKTRRLRKAISGSGKPDVVFFDGAGRTVHFLTAFARGVKVVIVSSKKEVHEKGFQLGRILSARQHWMIQDVPGISSITKRHRALGALFRVRLVDIPTLFSPSSPDELDSVLSRHKIPVERPLILFTPGGGAFKIKGARAVDIFLEAARIVADNLNVTCVVVSMAKPSNPGFISDNIHYLQYLTNQEFTAMIKISHLCVMGGGSVIGQVLANGRTGIAVPLGRVEQNNRVEECRGLGTVISSPPEPVAIAHRTIDLYGDPEKDTMIARAASMGIVNGVDLSIRALEELFQS